MSLIDALKADDKPRSLPGAVIREWLATLTEEEQALVLEYARDPRQAHTRLIRIFMEHGCGRVTGGTMREWRVSVGWERQ